MIRFSFEPGGSRRDRVADEIRFAARPLVQGLVAAALDRAQRRHGHFRDEEELSFESRARIDVQVDTDELVEAIRTAAVDGLQRFLDGLEEGLRAMEEKAQAAAPDDKPKRKPRKPARKRGASASSSASA